MALEFDPVGDPTVRSWVRGVATKEYLVQQIADFELMGRKLAAVWEDLPETSEMRKDLWEVIDLCRKWHTRNVWIVGGKIETK